MSKKPLQIMEEISDRINLQKEVCRVGRYKAVLIKQHQWNV